MANQPSPHQYHSSDGNTRQSSRLPMPSNGHKRVIIIGLTLVLFFFLSTQHPVPSIFAPSKVPPPHLADELARCRQLLLTPGPPWDFYQRAASDRFEIGTPSVLIRNAKLWTGGKNGTEVIKADMILDKGIIRAIGHLTNASLQNYGINLVTIDAKGAWVTPGIVDVHSHLGVLSSPELEGSNDGNSMQGIVQPWLRSLDALNTHDEGYPLSVAGGVTTSLILPGSANAIGGQAFVIKLRETSEKSSSSMVLEPPYQINTSFPYLPPRWRHIKHACGENPSGSYDGTRMDTIWAFRQAYHTAQKIKERQDEYCTRALSNNWEELGEFPEDLKWEALVDVLRGRTKVNTHCYEAVDVDDFVRLSNEYKFSIAAFHHGSESYLVPDVIKRAYGEFNLHKRNLDIFLKAASGKPPAVALFAAFARYKRESYRSSQFAPRILAENGLTVLMKSDHPAMNSRFLLYEAQQAYYYGLPWNLALQSVTTNSAEVLGMGHRIGYLKKGYDADVVIWDSHPLALGATPSQVFIDGIAQLPFPHVVEKPDSFQILPKVPNFDAEAREVVAFDGLPPLTPKKLHLQDMIMFTNVKSIRQVKNGFVEEIPRPLSGGIDSWTVVIRNGSILCYGYAEECSVFAFNSTVKEVDLEDGSISPGLVSFGFPLGLQEIAMEPSTNDGIVYEPLVRDVPRLLGAKSSIIRAIDGLQFGTRNALLGYRFGVTTGITAPVHEIFFGGLATAFSLGASHKFDDGAILQEVTSLHVSIERFGNPSVSTQIATLRRLLLVQSEGEMGVWFQKVAKGEMPLVVGADNADIIATLLNLKQQVETETRQQMRLTIYGGSEASLLAKELAEANVGVIVSRSRPFTSKWESRRIIPGPPMSNHSAIVELLAHNVTVGIGCDNFFCAPQNLPFDIAWAAIESGGRITKEEALAMGSTNILNLLGVNLDDNQIDLVATRGGDLLSMSHKVAAIISPRQNSVHMFGTK